MYLLLRNRKFQHSLGPISSCVGAYGFAGAIIRWTIEGKEEMKATNRTARNVKEHEKGIRIQRYAAVGRPVLTTNGERYKSRILQLFKLTFIVIGWPRLAESLIKIID